MNNHADAINYLRDVFIKAGEDVRETANYRAMILFRDALIRASVKANTPVPHNICYLVAMNVSFDVAAEAIDYHTNDFNNLLDTVASFVVKMYAQMHEDFGLLLTDEEFNNSFISMAQRHMSLTLN